MKLLATVRIALKALRLNKMRSGLTMLGIVIGVGAVIAMASIGNGAKAQVEAQIASLGSNVVLVFAGSITTSGLRVGTGSSSALTVGDAKAILSEVPGIAAVSPEVRTETQVAAGPQNWFTRILGVSPMYFEIRQWALADGVPFSSQDVRSAGKVAILGKTVAQQLFGSDDPLGQSVRIKNVPFVVVGVLTSKGLSLKGIDEDDLIIVPYTSAMKRLMGKRVGLRAIAAQAADASVLGSVQQDIIALLRQRHRLGAEEDDDFTVRTQDEIAETATETSRVMALLLGAIASVSLLVGGIGIMNIMLVSVTERTREIGIRIAVGAHARDIMLQFLIEAVTLSSLGGIIGIAAGVLISKTVSSVARWPVLISLSAITTAFLFSMAVGIFFGFYPARKASALDPIDALRYE